MLVNWIQFKKLCHVPIYLKASHDGLANWKIWPYLSSNDITPIIKHYSNDILYCIPDFYTALKCITNEVYKVHLFSDVVGYEQNRPKT